MQFAVSPTGEKITPTKGEFAICPGCGAAVRAKCGQIKVHHWAHVTGQDCDSWFEPETEWHRSWKALFERSQVEVTMGAHRADIRNAAGTVIELQNSTLSAAEIQEREQFYGAMIWVLNAEKFAERFFLMKRMGTKLFSFKWKQMKPSWLFAKRPIYLDFGGAGVMDLLGGQAISESEFRSAMGELQSVARSAISRYEFGADPDELRLNIDPTLLELPEELLRRGILRIHTLYEKGKGSGEPISHADFRKSLGVD